MLKTQVTDTSMERQYNKNDNEKKLASEKWYGKKNNGDDSYTESPWGSAGTFQLPGFGRRRTGGSRRRWHSSNSLGEKGLWGNFLSSSDCPALFIPSFFKRKKLKVTICNKFKSVLLDFDL